jgi:hypothetical protein
MCGVGFIAEHALRMADISLRQVGRGALAEPVAPNVLFGVYEIWLVNEVRSPFFSRPSMQ